MQNGLQIGLERPQGSPLLNQPNPIGSLNGHQPTLEDAATQKPDIDILLLQTPSTPQTPSIPNPPGYGPKDVTTQVSPANPNNSEDMPSQNMANGVPNPIVTSPIGIVSPANPPQAGFGNLVRANNKPESDFQEPYRGGAIIV